MQALLDVFLQLAGAALMLFGGYAIQRLATWLKLREDSEVRAYLNQALERGVDLALAELRGRLPAYARMANPEVDAAVERVAQYARDTVPDALARFGIDSAGLRDRAKARLAARTAAAPAAPAA